MEIWHFPATHILREINFCDFGVSKSTNLTFSALLNYDFGEFWALGKLKWLRIKIQTFSRENINNFSSNQRFIKEDTKELISRKIFEHEHNLVYFSTLCSAQCGKTKNSLPRKFSFRQKGDLTEFLRQNRDSKITQCGNFRNFAPLQIFFVKLIYSITIQ